MTGYRKIAIVARREKLLEETAKKMKKHLGSGKVIVLAKDVGTEEGCKSAVEKTVATFGSKFGNKK